MRLKDFFFRKHLKGTVVCGLFQQVSSVGAPKASGQPPHAAPRIVSLGSSPPDPNCSSKSRSITSSSSSNSSRSSRSTNRCTAGALLTMTPTRQQASDETLALRLEQSTAEVKKVCEVCLLLQLQQENDELKTQLSRRNQLFTGRINTADMAAIQEDLEQEHRQLLLDREEELAALKQQVHKLDTAVMELQQQQQQLKRQQQDWLARIVGCSCGTPQNEDDATEHRQTTD
ncbi:hypothetical protein Esti_000187 [Eimeria stiedai]